MNLDAIPVIRARNWTPRTGSPQLIVIHSMECPLERGRARSVANWFAGPTSPQASAHYMVDPGEVICGVVPPNEAWHVGGANTYLGSASIGIEQTGYARFGRDEWLTGDGSVQLDVLVDLVGSLCDRWGIPRVWLEADGLAYRRPGITSHRLCSESGIGTDHWDPGFNWPVDEFMRRLCGSKPKPSGFLPKDDDDMIDRYLMRANNDLAVYLVSPGLGWRWHVPAGQMASIVYVLGLNKGKILNPPTGAKVDVVEGQRVWVCSPDFLNAIPAA